MFRSKKREVPVRVAITDTSITYLTLDRDNQGFFVVSYGSLPLDEGTVVKGEVCKAKSFVTTLKQVVSLVTKNLPERTSPQYTLLLPHENFLHTHVSFPYDVEEKNLSRNFKSFLLEHDDRYPWVRTHYYLSSFDDSTDGVYVRALDKERYGSYYLLAHEAGIGRVSIESVLHGITSFLPQKERCSVILFEEEVSRILEYERGYYLRERKFQVSYRHLAQAIAKHIQVERSEGQQILDTYGVSRAHKDPKVFSQMMRSVSPLLDFLRKKKSVSQTFTYIWYLGTPLAGMADLLEKRLGGNVIELDIFNSPYQFHEVLSLPREESNKYALLIASAVEGQ